MVKMERKTLAKYTSEDDDIVMMSDAEFVDYASELVQHQEGLNNTSNVTNVIQTVGQSVSKQADKKEKRTLKEWLHLITTGSIVMLVVALCILFVCSVLYFIVYFNKDSIKRTIDFSLLLRAVALVVVFGIFVGLFTRMRQHTKKIIALL